jgi:hypothetical protein
MQEDKMRFDVNQTDFPSEFHKEIWNIGRLVVPLDVSLADVTDPETREGCKQIYSYTQDILEDMYKNPDVYPNKRALDTCWGKFDRLVKSDAKPDESGLNWIMPVSKYERGKHRHNDFTVMSRLGFTIESDSNNDYVVIKNTKYPLFLKYWYLLYCLAEKRKIRKSNYVMYCDFRLFAPKYKRTPDDLFRVLSDEYRNFFKELHEYAISKGAKLETHKYYGRFRYLYKNDYVLIFDIQPLIEISYCVKNDWYNSLNNFVNEAEKQPDSDELLKYIQNEIRLLCGACKNCRMVKNPPTDIGGKRLKGACFCTVSKASKPLDKQVYTKYDFQMLKRMLDIRFAQMDNA